VFLISARQRGASIEEVVVDLTRRTVALRRRIGDFIPIIIFEGFQLVKVNSAGRGSTSRERFSGRRSLRSTSLTHMP
jgi:hypothetical protein